jgi:hypothetical protein
MDRPVCDFVKPACYEPRIMSIYDFIFPLYGIKFITRYAFTLVCKHSGAGMPLPEFSESP